LQIHFRQCGHRRGASRAMSSSMYNFSKCRLRPRNLDNQIVDSLVFRSSDVGVTCHTARRN
jgi:hypothetical protein